MVDEMLVRWVAGGMSTRAVAGCLRKVFGVEISAAGVAAGAVASLTAQKDRLLLYYQFPEALRPRLKTTNPLVIRELERKFAQAGVFSNARSWKRLTYFIYRNLMERGYAPRSHLNPVLHKNLTLSNGLPPDRLDAILAPFVLMCLFVRPLGGRCHRERRKREVVSVSTSIPLSLATLSWKRQV